MIRLSQDWMKRFCHNGFFFDKITKLRAIMDQNQNARTTTLYIIVIELMFSSFDKKQIA
jgi:hypothetical protein